MAIRKSKRLFIGASLAVIVTAVFGVLYYFIFFRDDGVDTADESVTHVEREPVDDEATMRAMYDEDMRLFDVEYTGLRRVRITDEMRKAMVAQNQDLDNYNDTEASLMAEREADVAAAMRLQRHAEGEYQRELAEHIRAQDDGAGKSPKVKEAQRNAQNLPRDANQAKQHNHEKSSDSFVLLNLIIDLKSGTIRD